MHFGNRRVTQGTGPVELGRCRCRHVRRTATAAGELCMFLRLNRSPIDTLKV